MKKTKMTHSLFRLCHVKDVTRLSKDRALLTAWIILVHLLSRWIDLFVMEGFMAPWQCLSVKTHITNHEKFWIRRHTQRFWSVEFANTSEIMLFNLLLRHNDKQKGVYWDIILSNNESMNGEQLNRTKNRLQMALKFNRLMKNVSQ